MKVPALILLSGLALLPLNGRSQVRLDSAGGSITLENRYVRLVLRQASGGYRAEYFARGKEWTLVFRSGHLESADPLLVCERLAQPLAFTAAALVRATPDSAAVVLEAVRDSHTLRRTISLRAGDRYFHLLHAGQMRGVHEISRMLSSYSFVPGGRPYAAYAPLDFVWTPQLRPDSADVIADHTFRSPALMFQEENVFGAVIPDVDRIQPWRNVETSADVQVGAGEAPLVTYGIRNWRTRAHVFYTHTDAMTSLLENSRIGYGYFLFLRADAPPREGYRDVVRFHWTRWGRAWLLKRTGPQSEPFDAYVRKAWREYLPTVTSASAIGTTPVTLISQERLAWSNGLPPGANRDCWFNVWFNALRTAHGVHAYATEHRDTSLARQAEGVLNLWLSAPRPRGIAPTIFYLDSAGGRWVNDHGWGGIEGGRNYAMFHNAWTGVWLLEWAARLPARKGEILRAAGALAEFLAANQRPSGVIPSWYDPETLTPATVFRDENAETAGAALFLSEYARLAQEPAFRAAAEKAMEYVFRKVLPEQKWFDFETFFSCSRKPLAFADPFTGQHPQNTLSMHQAAEACLSLYASTGEQVYRDRGIAILDYLCLYQQVWSPPWLSCQLFGGFGVQNTDGEWSDSRQGYFALTLMRYYQLTGEREYFERAVAALRAMFSLFESPSSPRTAENYAHAARDRQGGVTGIHWGTGSSVVSIQVVRARYGGAFVNVAGSWGCGIDGCSIPAVDVRADTIALELRDDLRVPRPIRVTFGHLRRPSYAVAVNGRPLGTFGSSTLENGIEITP